MSDKGKQPSIMDALSKAGGVQRLPQGPAVKRFARDGKQGWNTYHDPAVVKQIKLISTETGKSQQQLASEAINMLFARYGKQQIA